jgi:hypothetical protein
MLSPDVARIIVHALIGCASLIASSCPQVGQISVLLSLLDKDPLPL